MERPSGIGGNKISFFPKKKKEINGHRRRPPFPKWRPKCDGEEFQPKKTNKTKQNKNGVDMRIALCVVTRKRENRQHFCDFFFAFLFRSSLCYSNRPPPPPPLY